MKAVIYKKYGLPDVLKLINVEKPAPKDNEVLINVRAASVNSWDWDRLTGKPYIYRLLFGITKPKLKILGADIAGVVESTGKNITRFKPGDEVFGDLCECGWGGFAEYVCAREKALTLKPPNMTFKQASAIPQAGVLALQGIRYKRQIKAGDKVLINGAGGGVGTFAIQMAKNFGAEITGVDSSNKKDLIIEAGADHFIDYTKEDFTKNGKQYDRIIDVIATRSVFDYKRALRSGGTYAMIGGTIPSILQIAFMGPWFSMTGTKRIGLVALKPNKDLSYIIELFETGKLVPVIDKCYKLDEVPEALKHIGEGKVRGKIVISIESREK